VNSILLYTHLIETSL